MRSIFLFIVTAFLLAIPASIAQTPMSPIAFHCGCCRPARATSVLTRPQSDAAGTLSHNVELSDDQSVDLRQMLIRLCS